MLLSRRDQCVWAVILYQTTSCSPLKRVLGAGVGLKHVLITLLTSWATLTGERVVGKNPRNSAAR